MDPISSLSLPAYRLFQFALCAYWFSSFSILLMAGLGLALADTEMQCSTTQRKWGRAAFAANRGWLWG
jgi:hypothetical protein